MAQLTTGLFFEFDRTCARLLPPGHMMIGSFVAVAPA